MMRKGVVIARSAVLAILTILGIALGAQPAMAQTPAEFDALKKQVDALKEGQAALQKELQQIKTFLAARPTAATPPPSEAIVKIDGAPFKGKKDARVTIVDFTDYQ